jgi:hypothetical protein
VTDPTVIAVDWSGARGHGRHNGIWLCAKDNDGEFSRGTWARTEVVDYIAALPGPLIVGFDFSFGLPAWFANDNDCSTIDEVWTLAAREGERWLAPEPPFWRARCGVPVDRRFRRCESSYPTAKSVFQLVGNGQVGAGSVRGMPLLVRLRAAGVAIWPFDEPAARIALEIYPSAQGRSGDSRGPFANEHERDAVCSARVMWDHRETFAALRAANDPITRLEGDIWAPTALL